MPQILEQPKTFDVKLGVGEHFTPEGNPCDDKNHDKCNWEEIVKQGLESMFKEIRIDGVPISTNNLIRFTISLLNRSDPHRSDIISILDDFISANPTMTIESMDVQPIKKH